LGSGFIKSLKLSAKIMAASLHVTQQPTGLKNSIGFIICLLIPLAIGGISGYITVSEINTWYSSLRKPPFNPPNALFGPVWTVLYVLMGISSFLIWKSPKTQLRKKALVIYGTQLFLNFWWSILFFSFHLLFIPVIEILALWSLIIYMIISFNKINKPAAYLNIPYLAWVSFASLLSVSIWLLN
jgi:tryptophan-rich sensory protein